MARAVCSHYLRGREHKEDVVGHLIEVKALFVLLPAARDPSALLASACEMTGARKLRREVSGLILPHGAQNGGIKRGGGVEKGYRVVVTGELMALREKGCML